METLLRLGYSMIRRNLCESFLFKRKPLNLYLFMFEEIALSFFRKGYENFYRIWKALPEKEFIHLLQHYNLNKIEKVIVVGAGAIPYTAIFFSKKLAKPIYVIEKNALAYFACSRLLRELRIDAITVIKGSGQLYCEYDNSLVIVSLHTHPKQKVLERVLGSNKHNQIVVIRQPLTQNIHLFESIYLNKLKCTTIKHNIAPLLSVFIATEH